MTTIIGRHEELELVGEYLHALAGGSAALVIEGAPGIGKTTVWRAALDRAVATGYKVLRCRPAESEAVLPFAGLIDIVGPIAEAAFASLSVPRRHALEVAMLRREPAGAPGSRGRRHSIYSKPAALARGPITLEVNSLAWDCGGLHRGS